MTNRVMNDGAATHGPDAALAAFLDARDDRDADLRLAALFGPDTDRILAQVIARALGPRFRGSPAAEDVASEARVRLLTRVRALRARGTGESIADFAGYVATVGFNSAYVFLRTRYPARTRLKNQVRYIVTRDRRLQIDEAQRVSLRAGPRAARPRGTASALRENPRAFADTHRVHVHGRPLADAVVDLIGRLDDGIEMDDFVDALATLLGTDEGRPEAEAVTDMDLERVPDTARDVASRLDDRQYLERVWTAIGGLQPRQRAALLLNLRDPGGGSALRLLPLIGVASVRDIARAVDMPVDALSRLWESLPLDDLQIGAHFGITRQQVINLRKTARVTLARRLR